MPSTPASSSKRAVHRRAGLGGEGWTTMTITTPTGKGNQRADLRSSASLRTGGCVSNRIRDEHGATKTLAFAETAKAAALCNRRPPPASRRCGWASIWAPATWCRWWSTAMASRLRYVLTGPMWCAMASSGTSSAPSPSCADILRLSSSSWAAASPCGDLVSARHRSAHFDQCPESAGLEISHVLDEPTAVADLLQLDNAGWWISAAAPPGSPSLNRAG